MAVPRPFALMQTKDQWLRAFHKDTSLLSNVVQLGLVVDTVHNEECDSMPLAAGLAFDPQCRLYHSFPNQDKVERQLWASPKPAEPFDLFTRKPVQLSGDFHSIEDSDSVLREPRGLAVDNDNRLFVAESASKRILIFDLWNSRILRRVLVSGRPLDMAVKDNAVLVLQTSPAALVKLEAHSVPRKLALPLDAKKPERVAVSPDGEIFVLDAARSDSALVISNRHEIPVAFATDIEFLPGSILVVARRPKEDFLRYRIEANSIEEMSPLKARDYDGLGIVRTPDNRIGFFTSQGFRHAVAARVRYKSTGRVITYRLDSGEFRTTWGRLFLDACIPKNTSIRIACVAADDPPLDEEFLQRRLPDNITQATIYRPDLSPPMPPKSLIPDIISWPLHRRETGSELPFTQDSVEDKFATYEAPILTGPGRYLWVALELTGNTRLTPQLRSLRAEYPAHDYLRRLPRIFSREEQSSSLLNLQGTSTENLQQPLKKVFMQESQPPSFLHRYLNIFDGFFGELDSLASARHALLDPEATPPEALNWLAGFVGLVLDKRWPESTQRAILAQASYLFRFRGTVPGLRRFLELYLDSPVFLIEKFRFRGLGVVGASGNPESRAILGAGFRVGGETAQEELQLFKESEKDAFETHAHQFSVIIPAQLTPEQFSVINRILDLHRPAHTLFDICTVEAGIRVGQKLHVGLTSIIGRSGGFTMLQMGSSFLGSDSVIGQPDVGMRIDNTHVGKDSRVG